MNLNPITRIILQTADGYYSMPWDVTAGIVIAPGAGVGTVVHAGNVYSASAADASAQVSYANPTAVPNRWTALTLTPDDDIAAALAKRGIGATLALADGDYRGQRVQMPDDEGLSVDVGAATDVEFYR